MASSQAVTTKYYDDLAAMLGVEPELIDRHTNLRELRESLRCSDH